MADWWHNMKYKYGDFGKITMRKHASSGIAHDIARITSDFIHPSAAEYVRGAHKGIPDSLVILSGTISMSPECHAALFGYAINDGVPVVGVHESTRARSPDDAQRHAERKRAEKRARKISRRGKK